MKRKYLDKEEVLAKFSEIFCDNKNAIMYIKSLEYIMDNVSSKQAEWVEQIDENGITTYHCSECSRCWYLNKPKANFCPECGVPISGGLDDDGKQ